MTFKDKLSEYMEILDCTAKDLSDNSGLSPATISRYRSGERVPEADSDNFSNLVKGIVAIAESKNISDITIQAVTDDFSGLVKNNSVDVTKLQANFNTLLI